MAEETKAQAIQARMDAILGELSAGGFTHTLNPATDATREHRTALEREYASLAASLPKTGAQARVLELTHMRLTSGFVPRPEPRDCSRDDEINADPTLRFLNETGQTWK